MRFPEFVEMDKYPIDDQKNIKTALEEFLLSTQLRSFTEAILRHKDTAASIKQGINEKLQLYVKQFQQLHMSRFFEDIIKKGAEIFEEKKQSEWKKTVKGIKKTVGPMMTRDPQLVSICYEIESIIKIEGEKLLQNEQKLAASEAKNALLSEGKLINFQEYNLINEIINSSITLNQFVAYMHFIQEIISPIKDFELHTESKEKAQELYDLIQKIKDKIRKNDEAIQEINCELELLDIELYWVESLDSDRIKPNSPPPGHTHEGCLATLSSEGYMNILRKDATAERIMTKINEKEQVLRTFLSEFSNHKGTLNQEHTDIQKFFIGLKYWEANFHTIHQRKKDLTKIASFQVDTKEEENIIYRNIRKSELELKELKQFAQSPTHSTERHKWFYSKGAVLGHVEHPFMCSIYLKRGALKQLLELKKHVDVDPKAVIIEKTNERGCFGIHEDALPFFNRMVIKVKIQSKNSSIKQKDIVVFPQELKPSNYLIDFESTLTAPNFCYYALKNHIFYSVIQGNLWLEKGEPDEEKEKKVLLYYTDFVNSNYKVRLPLDLIADIYFKMGCCAAVIGDGNNAELYFRTAVETMQIILCFFVDKQMYDYFYNLFYVDYFTMYTRFLYPQIKDQPTSGVTSENKSDVTAIHEIRMKLKYKYPKNLSGYTDMQEKIERLVGIISETAMTPIDCLNLYLLKDIAIRRARWQNVFLEAKQKSLAPESGTVQVYQLSPERKKIQSSQSSQSIFTLQKEKQRILADIQLDYEALISFFEVAETPEADQMFVIVKKLYQQATQLAKQIVDKKILKALNEIADEMEQYHDQWARLIKIATPSTGTSSTTSSSASSNLPNPMSMNSPLSLSFTDDSVEVEDVTSVKLKPGASSLKPQLPSSLFVKNTTVSDAVFAKWLEYAIMLRDREDEQLLKALTLSLQEQEVKMPGNLYQAMLTMQSQQGEQATLQQALQESLKTGSKPNPRTIQLIAEAKACGLVCHEIPRLGNCLYEAFWDQLKERKIALGIYTGKIRDYRDLREAACKHIINDLVQTAGSEFHGFLAEEANNYIIKLMADGTWGGELELRALSREFKVIVVVVNSDGKNSRGQTGPDIYVPPGASPSTPIITLGYERLVHYQSLRDGTLADEKLREALFEQVRTAEPDILPLSNKGIKPTPRVASSSNVLFPEVKQEPPKELPPQHSTLLQGVSSITLPSTMSMTKFKEKVVSLCDNNYAFSLKRSSANQLLIRFTNEREAWAEDHKEIKKELKSVIQLLQQAIIAAGIKTKQFQVKLLHEKDWSLTITAEPIIMDRIAKLLQEAGLKYFPSVAQAQAALFYKLASTSPPKSTEPKEDSKPEVICSVQ